MGNKIGFTTLGRNVVIVQFNYDIEPKGQRNIARYIEFNTIKYESETDLIVNEKIIDLDNTNYFDSIINNKSHSFINNEKFSILDDLYSQPKICDKFFIGGDAYYAVLKNGKYGHIDVKGNLTIPLEYESADDFYLFKILILKTK